MRYLSDVYSGDSDNAGEAVAPRRTKKRRVGDAPGELWGCLIPWNAPDSDVHSVELSKAKRKYTIGSSPQSDIRLSCRADVDETHCIIEWDGSEGNAHYAVKVTDCSKRGTYINGRAICEGGNKFAVLRDGSEIQLGKSGAVRFIYRQVDNAAGALRGLNKHYDLFNVLGQGSFATVVKALHKQQGKWYAVKMIPVHSLQQPAHPESADNGVPRLRATHSSVVIREVEVLETCQHPNICQLKEVFLECGRLNLVLELVPHGSLAAYLREMGVLFEHQAQTVTRQICGALAYMHARGIVHRDLKPENLLLKCRHPLVVKVSDFGLAKHIDTLRNLKTACGTRAYAAPEVTNLGPRGHYDEKVDSWSIGVVLFRLLTLHFPFSDKYVTGPGTGRKLTRRDVQINWALLSEFNVSETGQDFIRNLLEFDPKKRMSLTEATNHEWLVDPAPAPPPAKREDPRRPPAATNAPNPKGSSAHATPATKAPRRAPTKAPPEAKDSKDPAEALIESLTSMSISDADLPVSSRTRRAAKQKASVVVVAAAAAATTASSSATLPSDIVPGLCIPRRSSRIAALRNGAA